MTAHRFFAWGLIFALAAAIAVSMSSFGAAMIGGV